MLTLPPHRRLDLRAIVEADWLQIDYVLTNSRAESLYVVDTVYDILEMLGPRSSDDWEGYSSSLAYVCYLEDDTAFFVQGYTPHTPVLASVGMVDAPPAPLARPLAPGASLYGCVRAHLPLVEWHGTSIRPKTPGRPREVRRVVLRVDVVPESLVLKLKEIPEVPGHVKLRSRRYSGWLGAIDLPEPVTLLYWERDFSRFHLRRGFPEERD